MKKTFDVIFGTLDVTECTAVNPITGNREAALLVKGSEWDAPSVVFDAKMPENDGEAFALMTDACFSDLKNIMESVLETVEIR